MLNDKYIMEKIRKKLQKDVNKVKFWWHKIELGHGVVTPGQTSQRIQNIRAQAIPQPLNGKSVLDIGCWDGFFSFWCEEKGAIVTAVDNYQYNKFVENKYNAHLKGGEGFRVAAKWLRSCLALKKIDFVKLKGNFDIVLFFGIIYHQRHPLLALEHLYRLTKGCAIIETHYLKRKCKPILQFYAADVLNKDPTNYWGPSLSCIKLMLNDVGFRKVQLIKKYWDNDDRAIFIAYK